jgi:hypothetical protein
MAPLLLGIIIGFGLCALLVAAFFGVHLKRILEERREDQLRVLEKHHSRLKLIVGDLLAKADEVDSSSKYLQDQLDHETQQRLAETCRDLVLLGDVTKGIEEMLRTKQLSASRRALLHACEMAAHDARKLRAIKHIVQDSEHGQSEQGHGDAT